MADRASVRPSVGPESGSKPFDTLVVFLTVFLEMLICKKGQHTTIKHEKIPSMQKVNRAETVHCTSYRSLVNGTLSYVAVITADVFISSFSDC